MIIRNNYKTGGNCFNQNNSKNYLEEQKLGLRKSIDNLDARYKNGEIDHEKFKKIALSYAEQQQRLNEQMRGKSR